jgi:hypothetical protein
MEPQAKNWLIRHPFIFVALLFSLLALIAHIIPSDNAKVARDSSAGSSEVDAKNAAYEEANETKVVHAVMALCQFKKRLNDPDSLKVASAFQMVDGAFCAKYRARNGFGGVTVGSLVYMGDEMLSEGDSGFRQQWKKECSDSAHNMALNDVTVDFGASCWMQP